MVKSALPIAKVQYRDKDEYFCESSHETFIHRVLRLEENTHDIRYVPECEAELQRLLSLEHQMEKQDRISTACGADLASMSFVKRPLLGVNP